MSRNYDQEMNVEKTMAMRISSQPPTVRIIIEQNRLENVKYFK